MADPKVLIGLLIGGCVPFLFSSMLIRAVGRAAFFIVKECRAQFKDPEIMAGTKKPNYGRVVDICTSTAQKELIGPGLLAILAPFAVGFLLGPYALGGFLAGMILVGQLLAVFMANAGGAWDNAKKMIEDGLYGGKGSEAHKASVTGDTVGDPLKDTAGPAINPMVKVMNMVSLLGLGLVLACNVVGVRPDVAKFNPNAPISTMKDLPQIPTHWADRHRRGRGLRVADHLCGLAEQERVGRDEGNRRRPGRRGVVHEGTAPQRKKVSRGGAETRKKDKGTLIFADRHLWRRLAKISGNQRSSVVAGLLETLSKHF